MSLTFAPGPSAPSAAASVPAPQRPEPGLARGVWEAPRWGFFAALGVVLAFAVVYALVRAGVLKRMRGGAR